MYYAEFPSGASDLSRRGAISTVLRTLSSYSTLGSQSFLARSLLTYDDFACTVIPTRKLGVREKSNTLCIIRSSNFIKD